MDTATTSPEAPSAASPATEEADRDDVVLSELTELSLELARAIQAAGVKAAKAGDLDKAGLAETHFSQLALGIRRAIALKDRLRERQEEARREAEEGWIRWQEVRDDSRRRVARAVIRSIKATPADPPADRDRLTADLWTRLDKADRIDADRPDTVLPIETLVLRMCRDLGIKPDWPAVEAAVLPGSSIPRPMPPPDWNPRQSRLQKSAAALLRDEDDTS
jgi:hypothetical protein